MVASPSVIQAAVAIAVAALLTRFTIAIALRRSILAIPNQRSSHTVPTPTLGGLAIALPVLAWCGYRIGQDPLCWAVLGGGGMLAVLGIVDDLRDLNARVRFPIQIRERKPACFCGPNRNRGLSNAQDENYLHARTCFREFRDYRKDDPGRDRYLPAQHEPRQTRVGA